jgi:predicted PurR-regulated permease PerM
MVEWESFTKRIVGIVIFIGILVLSYLLLRPFLTAILSAIVFAYLCYPLYEKLHKLSKRKNIAAIIICVLVAAIMLILTLFLLQTVLGEVTHFNNYYKAENLSTSFKNFIIKLGTDKDFANSIGLFVDKAIETASASATSAAASIFENILLLVLQFFIFFVIMFVSLTKSDEFVDLIKNMLPFKEKARQKFLDTFNEVSNGVIYGIFVVGIIQGITAGIGFWIFGVPEALLLTIASMIAVIVPYLGSAIIWIPVAIGLMMTVSMTKGILLLLYGIVLIGIIENIIRPYIVSRKTKISFAIILIGMIGGFELLGLIGLIVGPLILDYLLLFIEFYRQGHLDELF